MHGGNVWQGESPALWLDHSANIRPEGAPDWVRTALEGAMRDLSYYPDPNMTAATCALAKYLHVPVNCVLPTAGGITAIALAAHVSATGMLICTPCFGEYAMLSGQAGVPVEKVSLLCDGRIIADPVSVVAPRLKESCTVWLCNPLNPVGTAFEPDAIGRLLAAVERVHGHLVVDEAFIEYCPEHTVAGWIETHPALIVTGSLTKILGIPGVRAGYLAAAPEVLEAVRARQLTWSLNCFAEAVIRALPDHAETLRADAERNAVRRAALAEALTGLGAKVYDGKAPFILARFTVPAVTIAARLKEKHILVRECTDFDGIDDGYHLRLAVRDETSNVRLVAVIREVLECAENR